MSKYFTAFCNTTSNQAYHKSMTLKEATKSAFTILKQVKNEAFKSGFYFLLLLCRRLQSARAALHPLLSFLQVMEEKLNETNVEAARVTPQGGFQLIKGEELESIIKELA